MKSPTRTIAVAVLSVLAWIPAAGAQNYPGRPVRIIVPLAPGGGTDLVTRLFATKLAEQTGGSFIVDNRAGGGTVIGTEFVARSAPDGYTLGAQAPEFTINPSLRRLPYDTLKDFSCIAQMTSGQYFLSTHPSVPVRTVKQLVALARSRPGQLTFGSSGVGSANHLSGMLLQQMTGTRLVHVPYRSGGLANAALLSGETDFMVSNTASAIPHIKAGRLRGIATTGPKRSPAAPDIPTVAESGVPGYVVTGFYLLIGRAGIPQGIVSALNAGIARAQESPEVKTRLAELGAEPAGVSPEACAEFVRSEIAKWAPVVKASGATAD